ncbi:hypothetical protein [Methylobacterium oxalidis]|uniref:Uncharacterized protein n=1 Tax=Methylobacterium oxalidis TaxID=944322 RepID=A0A512JAM2_9HYPH|nr:hypothetical protein [Methylobacterium oxalidis]GEP07018.1 hypothetical protein MOX02_50560 [Methylobacterium oxalidis]GJE29850.1 hypothetical protein LDDCCGHA_0012 [Methylobacterium oxalidis]GLS64629.1 hypothetical protein GCM10007888_30100 [Methylobacterium oxalidis]
MGRNRIFVGPEQRDFLDRAEGGRKECSRVLSRAAINSPVYVAAGGIVDAIDGLAEAVPGDRKYFHLAVPTTPGGNLTPAPKGDERTCSD